MPSPTPPTVSALNLYRGYRCRHSGICCSSHWDVPVEADRAARLSEAFAAGRLVAPGAAQPRLALVRTGDLPPGAGAIVARTTDGACVFFDRDGGRLCTIHGSLGHAALPAACRHFPRQFLLEDRGVRMAFSHVCPTAAALLFRDDLDRLAPMAASSLLADPGDAEGFDARGAVPPFVKPRLAGDAGTLQTWDEFVLAACDRPEESPLLVLSRLAAGAERVRDWTPARGPLQEYADEVLSEALMVSMPEPASDAGAARTLCEHVLASTPESLRGADRHTSFEPVSGCFSDGTLWRVVNRYLAARAWGAWSAYLGWGLRTQVACLAASLAVLGERWTARCQGAPVDAETLKAAFGDADLRVVHRTEMRVLCERLAPVEHMTVSAYRASLGLVTEA